MCHYFLIERIAFAVIFIHKGLSVKIIFDTDIGTDIDDALALSYLLAKKDCELMGVTTVSGEAVERAKLTDAIIKCFGKDIPVYPGSENPLFIKQRQTVAEQATKLSEYKHRTEFPENQALWFMEKCIRDNPSEVIILATGPFTNVAKLLLYTPEIAQLIKGVYIMGGDFRANNTDNVEWNMKLDPHAAQVLASADLRQLSIFGLNVTFQLQMSSQNARERFAGIDQLKPVCSFLDVFDMSHKRNLIFHDPLAAVAIFRPDVCNMLQGRLEVDIYDQQKLGYSCFNQDEVGPHYMAGTVNSDIFFDEFFSTVRDV